MPLSKNQIRHLKSLAHPLKPVVMVGQHGLTEAVLNELDSTLDTHELIKVKVSNSDRELRQTILKQMCQRSRSELVQSIGHIAVLFRRNMQNQKITLPKP